MDINLEVIEVPRPNLPGTAVPDVSKPALDKKILMSWVAENIAQFSIVMDPDQVETIAQKMLTAATAARASKLAVLGRGPGKAKS